MAKIEKNNNAQKRNSNKMPKGTMPKDKLTRFKLSGNIDEPGEYKHRTIADVKIVARSARAIKTYRQYVHGCQENRLPSSLRRSVHYFLTPMNRGDSDNPKDRRDNVLTVVDNSGADNADVGKNIGYMEAQEARKLMTSSTESAKAELLDAVLSEIQKAARYGNNKAELYDVVAKYSPNIVNETYNVLRSKGYSVNNISQIVFW